MSELTLNIYPQGHYYWVYPERLYSAGQRLIRKFLDEKLIEHDEYSLLVYTPDRVKIEITKKELDIGSFKRILDREKEQCAITCWEEVKSDTRENIQDKCKATALREEILGVKHPSELRAEEWIEGIKRVRESWRRKGISLSISDNEFLHFIMNPIGYDNENRIRSKMGLPLL